MDTAILFAGAPRFPMLFDGDLIVLNSAQAAEAARILDARRVVPVHHDSWAHFTEGHEDLEAAFTAAGLADRLDGWTQRPCEPRLRQDHGETLEAERPTTTRSRHGHCH